MLLVSVALLWGRFCPLLAFHLLIVFHFIASLLVWWGWIYTSVHLLCHPMTWRRREMPREVCFACLLNVSVALMRSGSGRAHGKGLPLGWFSWSQSPVPIPAQILFQHTLYQWNQLVVLRLPVNLQNSNLRLVTYTLDFTNIFGYVNRLPLLVIAHL